MGQKDITEKQLEEFNDVFADIYNVLVFEKKFPLVPVITLVLNLSNTRWNDYKSLAEITNIPPEFEPYFQDYKVKVVDIAFLEDSVIEKFTSDFKLVAKFFKNRRLGVEEWDDETQIKHVEALIDFITAFTDDPRYQYVKEDLELLRAKGGKTGMNDPYYDMLMNYREEKLARLIGCLLAEGDMDTMKQALVDREIRARLYKKYESEITIKTDKKEESVNA